MNDDNNAFVEQLERTGGFAYPSDCFSPPGGGKFVTAGMTLRDYLAAAAISGSVLKLSKCETDDRADEVAAMVAEDAYRIADAVLRRSYG